MFTLVLVDVHDAADGIAEAERLLAIAARRHGADYWAVGPLKPRLSKAGLGKAAETGVIPLAEMPTPIPGLLDPAAVVTPNARWHWRPLEYDPARARWPARLEGMLGPRTVGRFAVTADVHM